MELTPLKNLFNQMFGRWADTPNDQQYYVKIFFALVSALVCGLAGPTFAGTRGVIFGFLVYILALFVIRYLLEISLDDLGGTQKMITNSLVSYLMLWTVLWTLMYAFYISPEILATL
jgi:membrane associated rhomboid family serine protease